MSPRLNRPYVLMTAAACGAWLAVMFVHVSAHPSGAHYQTGRDWERRHPGAHDHGDDVPLTPLEQLGKIVFFDDISQPDTMGCVTCHTPETGGTNGDSYVNLHQVAITGANPHTIGSLRPQTNTYASLIAPFHECGLGGLAIAFGPPPTPANPGPRNFCGGNFWNARAEGNDWQTLSALFSNPALFPIGIPAGVTKHIGDEVFYTTRGNPLPISSAAKTLYATYFGPTADQALNPMPNPVEQNIPRIKVCRHVKNSNYASLYKDVWGVEINCSDDPVSVKAQDVDPFFNHGVDPSFVPERAYDISFKRLMLAVCAWQDSEDLNSFTSKRDRALDQDSDGQFPLEGLTAKENLGHDLFYNALPNPFAPPGIPLGPGVSNNPPFPTLKITNCAFCHSSDERQGLAPGLLGTDPLERYTDDSFHNIGTPVNPEIPPSYNLTTHQLIDSDEGIHGHLGDPYPLGFFSVPTLRNVDKRPSRDFVKAYTHNGWFKSLESLVHFYNTSAIANPTAGNPDPLSGQNDFATANTFGVTKCAPQYKTEKQALAHNCWPGPAHIGPGGPTPVLVGNLHLTSAEEAAIVAYLKTLSDEHSPKPPRELDVEHDRRDR